MGQRFPRQDSSGDDDIPAPREKYDDDDDDIPAPLEKYDVPKRIWLRLLHLRLFLYPQLIQESMIHLHHALLSKNIETYIDCRIHRGDEIAPSLLDAIEKSKLSVIIFSQKFASSSWCLIEPVHIMECKKKNGQFVVPIFYDISPSDLRKENGIYANAIAEHEKCLKGSMGKVHKWRAALADAANLSGFDNSSKTGSGIRGMHLNHADFKKPYDLKLLYVYSSSRNMYCKFTPHSLTYLDLEGYPFKSFPSKISSENLVEIQMHNSHIDQLWNEGQNLRNLKVMDLGLCDCLIKVPDLSQSPNIEHIDLYGCKSLVEIPSYFQYLEKLSYLNLTDCTKLKYLSEMPHIMVRHVRGYIIADALIRIMRMATALSKYLEQEEIEVASHLELEEESNEYVFRSLVCVVCIGGEIPSWFRDSCDQSSIRIKLSPKHFGGDFLGFAYSAVVAFDNYNVKGSLKLGCKINFKVNGDHRFCHRSCVVADHGEISDCSFNTSHVFIWFSTFDRVDKGNLNGVTDAIFEFYPVIDQRPEGRAVDCSNIIVTKCGILPLYLGDDWKIKGLKTSYAAVDLMSKMVTSRQTQRS
ncbi:unnamed protein product [Malus baccata var. baccata]